MLDVESNELLGIQTSDFDILIVSSQICDHFLINCTFVSQQNLLEHSAIIKVEKESLGMSDKRAAFPFLFGVLSCSLSPFELLRICWELSLLLKNTWAESKKLDRDFERHQPNHKKSISVRKGGIFCARSSIRFRRAFSSSSLRSFSYESDPDSVAEASSSGNLHFRLYPKLQLD